jgi:hypothetical protein
MEVNPAEATTAVYLPTQTSQRIGKLCCLPCPDLESQSGSASYGKNKIGMGWRDTAYLGIQIVQQSGNIGDEGVESGDDAGGISVAEGGGRGRVGSGGRQSGLEAVDGGNQAERRSQRSVVSNHIAGEGGDIRGDGSEVLEDGVYVAGGEREGGTEGGGEEEEDGSGELHLDELLEGWKLIS